MREECKEIFEMVSEYLDGDLDDDMSREIEEHLGHCPECRECVASLRKTVLLCREGGKEEMPPDARERLRSTLRECLKQNGT